MLIVLAEIIDINKNSVLTVYVIVNVIVNLPSTQTHAHTHTHALVDI